MASKTTLTSSERRDLVRFYSVAMERIAALISSNALRPKQLPRFSALVSKSNVVLRDLDSEVAEFIEKKLAEVYQGNIEFIDGRLRVLGVSKVALEREAQFAVIQEDAIRELLFSPETGLGPRLKRMSDAMRLSVKEYVQQHKTLLRQVKAINGSIAEGVLEGRTAAQTRDAVLSALEGTKPASVLGLERDVRATGPYQTFLEAPFVKIQTVRGVRRIHIFDHIQQLVTTKESEIRTRARNQRLQEVGIDLVQITPNPPITPDVCSLYAGRVFALTDEASQRTGYPHINQLPNGGPPFHPNCSHSTLPFVEVVEPDDADFDKSGVKGLETTRGGVPTAILDTDFAGAQRWFKERGGIQFAVEQNPQIVRQRTSSRTSKEVLKALGKE